MSKLVKIGGKGTWPTKIVTSSHGLGHQLIGPHCPEENEIIERLSRTLREALDGEELADWLIAGVPIAGIGKKYNEQRLQSALG